MSLGFTGAGLGIEISMSGETDIQAGLSRVISLMEDPTRVNLIVGETVIRGATGRGGEQLKGLKRHIQDEAPSHHKTADRLGATPLGAFYKAAESLTADATPECVTISIHDYGVVFSRVDHDVIVVPVDRQWLAIPCDKRSYGLKPENFPGMLDFFVIREGELAALKLRKTPKQPHEPKERKEQVERKYHEPREIPRGTDDILFWLRKRTVIPQDPSLLPTPQEFGWLIEAGIDECLNVFFKPLELHAAAA